MANCSAKLPLVSVLIGSYNARAFIGETLDSVLAQTYSNIEIVVIDDGSTDGTWDVLQSYGSRIRAFRQPNGGIAAARNAGLREARGDFIALLDHDDICEPERIAAQVLLMTKHPELVLCSSDFSAFDARGLIAKSYCGTYYVRCAASAGGPRARYPKHGHLDVTACLADSSGPVTAAVSFGDVYEELALGNFVHPPTVLFRRSVLTHAPSFDPDAGYICDWDWLVKAARTGPFGFLHRPLLRYRRSDSQVSSRRCNARLTLESIRVSMRIQRADPELSKRRRAGFNSSLGEMCLSAAEANVEHDRRMAAQLVARTVLHYHVVDWHLARALAKLVTPSPVLRLARRMRRRFRASRHAAVAVWASLVVTGDLPLLELAAMLAV